MKQSYRFEGIDCPNCAAKLERALNSVPGVTHAQVDFARQRLTIECEGDHDAVMLRVLEETARVEPGCIIHVQGKHADSIHQHDRHHGHNHQHEACDCGCCGHEHLEHHESHHAHEHNHPHHHDHEHAHQNGYQTLIRAGVAVVMLAGGFFLQGWAQIVVWLAAYGIAGWDVVRDAVRNVLHGEWFDEKFLMSVASIGAMCIGEYAEGTVVMALYQVGEWLQGRAVGKSRASIAALMDIRPDYANVLRNGEEKRVNPDEVQIGETMIIRPGERIALDGTVLEGSSAIDTANLTGESVPRDVEAGSNVISGCVNLTGLLTVRVDSAYGESTVNKILELVESSGEHKAAPERFITRFSRIYTPIVCALAALLAIVPSLFDGQWSVWVYRALTFLVISCPCALVISVPLTFFSGIGAASAQGVLIKGADHLERLAKIDTIVFDKTGTLTEGKFSVRNVYPVDMTAEGLMALVAHAEYYSTHPISKCIKEAFGGQIDMARLAEVEERAGYGVSAIVDGKAVHVGNERMMRELGIEVQPVEESGTVVYAVIESRYAGCIVVADVLKSGAKQAVQELRRLGVERMVMLSGDKQAVAEDIAGQLKLDEVQAELLPQDKVERLKGIVAKAKGHTAFVGDGMNDAPALACPDVGVSMGALGSDAAIEAADVVLMDDKPERLAFALSGARKTMRISWQNIVFSLVVKVCVMMLGAVGIANMWLAVFADVGVCMLVILNAMRNLRLRKR